MIFRQSNVSGPESSGSSSSLNSTSAINKAAARKVLVVDDDPVVLKAISAKLAAKGYRTVTASDAAQALNLARRERPDLVLLDVNFPPDLGGVDWNGFRIIQWLRMNEEVRDVPVIVMSANERAEYQHRATEMGAAGFLPKTIHSEGLLACIEMAMNHKMATRPNSGASGLFGFSATPAFRRDSTVSGSSEPSGHLKLGTI